MNTTATPATAATTPDALVRAPEAAKLFDVSESYWWAGVKTGKFPRGIKMSPRVTVWRLSSLYSTMAQLGK